MIPERPIAPDDMLAWLGRFEVSVLHAVPTLARQWLAAASPGFTDLPALRATLFAGEQLLPALVGSRRRTAPGSQVWNLYDPTETVLAKAAYRVPEPLPDMSVLPIGRAIPGAQVLVLDPIHRPQSGRCTGRDRRPVLGPVVRLPRRAGHEPGTIRSAGRRGHPLPDR